MKTFLSLLLFAGCLSAQMEYGGIKAGTGGTFDFGSGSHTVPNRLVTASQVSTQACSKIGETLMTTDTQALQVCTATGTPGTWALVAPPSPTASTIGQSLVSSGPGTAYLPVMLAQQIDERPLHAYTLKPPTDAAASVTGGSTATLCNLTGPGTLERIQFASSNPNTSGNAAGAGNDSIFHITVDGTAMPDIAGGLLFGTYGYDNLTSTAPLYFWNDNVSVDYYAVDSGNWNMGVSRRLLIHYTSNLTITWTNTSGSTVYIYPGVDYRTGTPAAGLYNPRYNKFHMTVLPISTTVGATAGTVFTPLPTQTPGSAGLVDSMNIIMLGTSTGPFWLEGHPTFTIDGAPGPLHKGTEDFFGCHFYFSTGCRSEERGLFYSGNIGGSTYLTGMYRFFHKQPVTFNTSVGFTMENGHSGEQSAGATVGLTIATVVFWYTVS